ncbi:MAG TPA: sugar phosphate nucleotidyltransferase, partial [Mycobacteriales bacterium]|nr:sugar phosphate nucleotidyltransferase [Mycobacteriales bacterium]
RPKFLLDLGVGAGTLIQMTRARLAALAAPETTYVITGTTHAAEVARQLPELPAANVLIEPAPRNTAPAIGLAAAVIHRRDPDAIMGSFAADHLVADEPAFHAAVRAAIAAAGDGSLVTIGISPTGPETGYGYLRRGERIGTSAAYRVEEFVEKPSYEIAEGYLRDGRYLWNAGMFVWRAAAFLEELRRQLPDLHAGLMRIAAAWDGEDREQVLAEVWPTLPTETVDVGVMEGARRVVTVPADLGWNDIGDWDTLAGILGTAGRSATFGDSPAVTIDCDGSLIYAGADRLVAALGVRDLVIVDTADALLVCPRDRAQDVKKVIANLCADDRVNLL